MHELLDTNILIDAIRGHKKAVSYLDSLAIPKISIITYFELLQGARDKKGMNRIKKGMIDFEIIEADYIDQHKAIDVLSKYKLSHGIDTFDSIIAAICINRSMGLVTRNIKHFDFIKGLKVVAPY